MWFHVARLLGMTVAEAQDRIDSAEFTEWVAYFQLDPWTGDRGDLQAGIIAATVANVNRTKGRARKPTEFMPEFGTKKKKKQTGKQMAEMFAVFANMHNKSVEKKGR